METQEKKTYLTSTVRNHKGQIVATLAINREFNIGLSFRNEIDRIEKSQRAEDIAKIRADRAKTVKIPDRWITPNIFTARKSKSPVASLMEIRLSVAVQQAAERLRNRAERYFSKEN